MFDTMQGGVRNLLSGALAGHPNGNVGGNPYMAKLSGGMEGQMMEPIPNMAENASTSMTGNLKDILLKRKMEDTANSMGRKPTPLGILAGPVPGQWNGEYTTGLGPRIDGGIVSQPISGKMPMGGQMNPQTGQVPNLNEQKQPTFGKY